MQKKLYAGRTWLPRQYVWKRSVFCLFLSFLSICMEKKCVLFIYFIYLFIYFIYLFIYFVSTLSSLGRNHVGLLFSNEEQKMAGP